MFGEHVPTKSISRFSNLMLIVTASRIPLRPIRPLRIAVLGGASVGGGRLLTSSWFATPGRGPPERYISNNSNHFWIGILGDRRMRNGGCAGFTKLVVWRLPGGAGSTKIVFWSIPGAA